MRRLLTAILLAFSAPLAAQSLDAPVNITLNPVNSAASAPALLLSGTIFTGGSGTTNFPHLLVQPSAATASTTWSATGTALGINARSTTNNLVDFQTDGTSRFRVSTAGVVSVIGSLQTFSSGNITAGGAIVATSTLSFTNLSNIYSPSINVIQWGNSDAASPVAYNVRAQSVVAGTSNGAGVNTTHTGSLSTGSGVSGDIIFQTGATGAGTTVQNTATNALVIKGATQNIRLPAITSDSGLTTSTVCQDTTNHALFSGSGTVGICLGTSSARFKHDIAPLRAGLAEIMRLRPVSYKLNADHGDPNKTLYGFTAEQMRPVLPKLVGLDAKGAPNTADYVGLIPVLVNAVKELKAEIDELKRKAANDNEVIVALKAVQLGRTAWRE